METKNQRDTPERSMIWSAKPALDSTDKLRCVVESGTFRSLESSRAVLGITVLVRWNKTLIREVVSVNLADFRIVAMRLRSSNDGGSNVDKFNSICTMSSCSNN